MIANAIDGPAAPESAPAWVSTTMPAVAPRTPVAISTPGRTRRAMIGAARKLTVEASIPGSNASAAPTGERCCTIWKNCATNSIVVPPSMANTSIPPSAVLNALLRNSFRSSSGSSRVRWRRTNTTPKARPVTSAIAGTGWTPSRANSLMP